MDLEEPKRAQAAWGLVMGLEDATDATCPLLEQLHKFFWRIQAF